MPAFLCLRAAFRLLRLTLHLLAGAAIVALAYPWLATPTRLALKRRWSRQLLGTLGVQAAPGATDAQCHGLLVANHISFLDIFALNAIAPAGFVAKDDVRRWPLIGWLCRHTDTIFIARGSRRAAQATRDLMLTRLQQGQQLAVFPEGTTSEGHDVLPFHGALFQSAVDANAPVTPLLLRYTGADGQPSTAAAYVGDTSLLQCLWSIACADGLAVHVEALPVLQDIPDRRQLAALAHRHIAHRLREYRADAGLSPSPSAAPVADRAGRTPAGLPGAPP